MTDRPMDPGGPPSNGAEPKTPVPNVRDQWAIWQARNDAMDAMHEAPDLVNDVVGYPYADLRRETRRYIREMEPWLRDSNIPGAESVWAEKDLARDPDEKGEYVGLKSVISGPDDDRIPRGVLMRALTIGQEFMGETLVSSEITTGGLLDD